MLVLSSSIPTLSHRKKIFFNICCMHNSRTSLKLDIPSSNHKDPFYASFCISDISSMPQKMTMNPKHNTRNFCHLKFLSHHCVFQKLCKDAERIRNGTQKVKFMCELFIMWKFSLIPQNNFFKYFPKINSAFFHHSSFRFISCSCYVKCLMLY